jgi:hypothetical protein
MNDLILKVQKIDKNKYIIIDQNNMIISCEYITTLKQAKQELKDIKSFFNQNN